MRLLTSLFSGFLIFFVGSLILIGIGVRGEVDAALWETSLFSFLLYAAFLSVCYIYNPQDWQQRYKLSVKKWHIPAGLGIGAITQFPLLVVVYLPFYPLIERDDISKNAEELVDRAVSLGDRVLLGVVVVLVAPIVEEIFFRGFLFQRFQSSFSKRFMPSATLHLSVVFTAILFALTHLLGGVTASDLLPLWGLFLVGLLLAYAVHITNRLGVAVLIHMGFNLLAFILILT